MTLNELPEGKSATLTVVGGKGALRRHFLNMGLDRSAAMADMRFLFIRRICEKTVVKPAAAGLHGWSFSSAWRPGLFPLSSIRQGWHWGYHPYGRAGTGNVILEVMSDK